MRKNGRGYRWHEHEERFDTTRHPNEPNRFGWVVEIDPLDPARFDADNTGLWQEVAAGRNGLGADQAFADQGEVMVKCRQVSDLLGATRMDRPEWIAIDPAGGEAPSDRSDPAEPSRFSTWPSGVKCARTRSATVVSRKNDGGLIGT